MVVDSRISRFPMVQYVNTEGNGHRMRKWSGGEQMMRKPLLGVILTFLGPAALEGQSVTPADLAGDWVVAAELYGETDYHRMTFRAVGDQLAVVLDGMKLEGKIR